MTIKVAKSAGFCAGVARAVDTAYKELAKNPGTKLVSLGQLIHNRTVTDDLATKGMTIVSNLDEITDETVLVRSHGIPIAVEEELRARKINYIDRTCPCVKAIHRRAAQAVKDGRCLIVLGEPTHPEVQGTVSHGINLEAHTITDINTGSQSMTNHISKDINGSVIVATDAATLLPQLNQNEKYTLVVQTTFDATSYEQIISALTSLIAEGLDIQIHNTICNATITRQKETAELAATCDTMIVIGDKGSANTMALYEISRKSCPNTILIATIHDLQLQYLKPSDKIGVTAGASTPPALTKEAVQLMSEFANAVPEETKDEAMATPISEPITESTPVSDAQAQPPAQPANQSFEEMLEESFKKPLHSGKIVKGTVIKVSPTEVTVDLGYKSDGIITRQEFTDDPSADITQLCKPGDTFDVFVIRVNDGDGNVLASKKKLDNQQNIKMLEEALEEKAVVTGKITEVIKGGLLAMVHGCRVFIPSSQVSNRFVEDLTQFKGQEMKLHILEIDRNKRRYVAGRKELATLEAKQIRDEMYEKLEIGQRIDGTVSRIVDFGAFVDIGGIDGLIHVSEMAWKRVRKVTDILQVGDKVTVTLIAVDKEKNKISLSLKDISNDPWNGITDKYPVGAIVEGQVVRLASFGAFVSLEDGIDGLVHISQIANRHIAKADEVLKVGQVIQVKITNVDLENHRINLSKREADLDLGYEVYDDEDYYEGDDDGYADDVSDEEVYEEVADVEPAEEPAVESEEAPEVDATEDASEEVAPE